MSFYTPNQTEEVVTSLTAHIGSALDADAETQDTIRSSILEWLQTRNAPPAKPKAAPKAKVEEKPAAKAAPKAKAAPPPEEEEPAPAPKAAPKAKAKAKAKAPPPPPEEEEEPAPAPKSAAKPKASAKAAKPPPEEEEAEAPPAKPKASPKTKAAPAKCDRSVRTATGFKICGNPAVEGGTKCEPCLKLASTKTSAPAPREPAAKSAKSRVTKDRPVVEMVQVPEGDYAEYLYNPEHGIVFDPSQNNGAVGCFGQLEEEEDVAYSFDQIYELEEHHLELLRQWKIPQVQLGNPEEDVNEEDDGQAIEEDEEDEE